MDKLPSQYSDLEFRLRIKPDGNPVIVEDGDAIAQSIKTILGTYPGERLMLPEFGSRVREILFEPISDLSAEFLEMEIQEAIERWEDRVLINKVEVIPDYDRNIYRVEVHFTYNKTQKVGIFSTNLRSMS